MLSSIVKFSKSLSIKILVGIIILPFVFWGMGDIFSGGNQNIIAKIDSEKVSTRDFAEYLNRLNLNDQQIKDLKKTDLIQKILSEYIGRRIINLEMEDLGIVLSDSSLKDIIVNDKTFFKDKKFSRTEYEKFLIQSGVTAPMFEDNIAEQEKRRQLLTFLSRGTSIPDFLVQNAFNEENQVKDIRYIDLNEIFEKKQIKKDEINKIYNENKDLFTQEFKSISFSELTPEKLTGLQEFDKNFFNKVELIENDILDGKNILDIAKLNNLKLIKTGEIDKDKKDVLGQKNQLINNELFKKIFKKNEINSPELFEFENKYFIAQISSVNKIAQNPNDKSVVSAITGQIKFKSIIDNNMSIGKKISEGNFKKKDFEDYAKKNNSTIKYKKIKGLEDEGPFNKNIIKRIFKLDDNEINLISDSQLKQNYLIQIEKTEFLELDKKSKDFDKYKSVAKLNLSNSIYFAYDARINKKYKIDINNKAVNRLKNSF